MYNTTIRCGQAVIKPQYIVEYTVILFWISCG